MTKRIIIFLFLFALRLHAVQSWGVVQQGASQWKNQAAVTAYFSVPVTSGNLLIVKDCWMNNTSTVTFTDALTQTISAGIGPISVTGPPAETCQAAYIANTGAGTESFTCTLNVTINQMCVIYEVAGAATTTPLDLATSNTGTSATNLTGAATVTTGANEFIFAGWGRDGNNCDTNKPGATFIALDDLCVQGDEWGIQAAAGSVTPTMVISPNTANYVFLTMAFKPGAGAAPTQQLVQMNYQNATNFVMTHPPTGGGSNCTIAQGKDACLAVHFPNAMASNHTVFIWEENNIPGMTLSSISDNNGGTVQSIPGNPFINASNSLDDRFYVISNTASITDYVVTAQYTCGGVPANCTTAYLQIWDFNYNTSTHANDGVPSENGAIGCTGPCTMTTNNLTTTYANELQIAIFDAAGCNTNCATMQFTGTITGGWQAGKIPINSSIDWGGGFVSGADAAMYRTVSSTSTFNESMVASLTTGYDTFVFSLRDSNAPSLCGSFISLLGIGCQ